MRCLRSVFITSFRHSVQSLRVAAVCALGIGLFLGSTGTVHAQTITSIEPESGPPGSFVNIWGTGFGTDTPEVRIGGKRADVFFPSGQNKLLVKVPYGTGGVVDVSVTVDGSTVTATDKFSVLTGGEPSFDVMEALSGVQKSSSDAGDFDDDGDIDLVIAGQNASGNPVTWIYENDGDGNFSTLFAGLTGVRNGSVKWGDFDSDGDLDLVVTGSDGSNSIAKVYRNEGQGQFSAVGAGLTGVRSGSANWVDFNTDGNLDLFITGLDDDGANATGELYRGDGTGTFTLHQTIEGVSNSSSSWAEITDNTVNTAKDLVVIGKNNSEDNVGKVYRNNTNELIKDEDNSGIISSAQSGVVELANFDNRPACTDAFISGSGFNRAYRNGCLGVWNLFQDTVIDLKSSSADFGDFDGNGKNNLIHSGIDSDGNRLTKLYEFKRKESDPRITEIQHQIVNVAQGSLTWGDYDGDGDLDLLITGLMENGEEVGTVYENTDTPLPPIEFVNVNVSIEVELNWSQSNKQLGKATRKTANDSLVAGYNIYRYRTSVNVPDSADLTKINDDLVTDTSYTDADVDQGNTYYYRVVPVDAEGNEGVFSPEASATVSPEMVQENGVQLSANGVAQVPSSEDLDFGEGEGLTIEFWVKHDGTSDADAHLVSKSTGSEGYQVRFEGSGNVPRIAVGLGDPGCCNEVEEIDLVSTEGVPAHQWTHVAVINNPEGDLSIYLNGELDASASGGGVVVGESTENLYIGSKQGTGSFLSGQMDDVRIWETNRFGFQIEDNYLQELAAPGDTVPSPSVAYYPFDEAEGGWTPDLGGAARDSMQLLGASNLTATGALPTPPRTFARGAAGALTSPQQSNMLRWDPRTSDDGDNQAVEYRVYRSESPDFPSESTTQVNTVAETGSTYADADVASDLPYWYGVAAVVGGVESDIARAAGARPSATGGNALDLTGTGGFATADVQPTFANSQANSGAFTIEFWLRHDGESNSNANLVNKGIGSEGYRIRFEGLGENPTLAVGIGDPGCCNEVNEIDLTSDRSIPANRWTHVAVTNDPAGDLSIFINGTLDASTAGIPVGATDNPLRMGTTSDASGNFLSGQIDNLRFWKKVRAKSEIRQSLQGDLFGHQTGLAANFRFDEENGPKARSSAREFTSLSLSGDASFAPADRAGILYSIDTGSVSDDGSTFSFDVGALAEREGRRIGNLSVVLDYNEAGFGTNVASNDDITITRKGLLDKEADGSDVYGNVTVTDVSDSRVRIDVEYLRPNSPGDAAVVPSPGGGVAELFEVTLQIEDPEEIAGTSLVESAMQLGTFRADNATLFPDVHAFERRDNSRLPVELVSFEATRDGATAVALQWRTASETNNAGFTVQRRVTEGGGTASWQKIGFVESKAEGGTSTETNTYRFTDAETPYEAETVRYRLKQLDINGATHLSDEITVDLGTPKKFILRPPFPNPARGQATVRYELPRTTDVRLSVYDVLGRRVATLARGNKEAGRKQLQFQTKHLSSGTYFLRLSAGGQTRTQKLTVVR